MHILAYVTVKGLQGTLGRSLTRKSAGCSYAARRAFLAGMSLPPRHPQTVPYVDESIRRRAAKSSVSFIELLEKSAGYDDDIESIASSIGKDQENVEGLEFLESSGYLQRKKAPKKEEEETKK